MTVLHDPIERQAVRAAFDDCLSGLDDVPSRRADILKHVRGEKKVKKKLSAGFILAIVWTLLMAGAAVAAGLGLFEQLTSQDEDARLSDLDAASTKVDLTLTMPEGQILTIDQAYYDGTRVFLSYRQTGVWRQAELGEGQPEGVVNWDREEPGVIFGKECFFDGTEGQRVTKWLDGSAPRWALYKSLSVHDGLELADGTYLEIIGGSSFEMEDGSIIGWKECTVPEEAAAEEITVCIGVFGGETLYCQTADTLYTARIADVKTIWHPFTLKKDTDPQRLTGSIQGDDWSAVADISLNPIDLRGEIKVTCPKSWNDFWQTSVREEGLDMIMGWVLYRNGEPVEGYDLDGSSGGWGTGEMTFSTCWRTGGETEGFQLVPDFLVAGERPELGIELTLTR